MAKLSLGHILVHSTARWPSTLQHLVSLWAVFVPVIVTAGQQSRYYIDPRPPAPQQYNVGTFVDQGGGTRTYPSHSHNNNGVVQPAILKPMDAPIDSSLAKLQQNPLRLTPPVLFPLTPPPSPLQSAVLAPVPSVIVPAIAPVSSRRQSTCYECPGPYACRADFLWAACDADCIKIDGTILSERYLPERAKDSVAVQGEFRGCFSDRKWSEYLKVVQPNSCVYFEYTKDFPYVHGTVCRCGLDFCNSATSFVRDTSTIAIICSIAFFLVWTLNFSHLL